MDEECFRPHCSDSLGNLHLLLRLFLKEYCVTGGAWRHQAIVVKRTVSDENFDR